MKISPTILINRKCHSHQLFLASECEWGLPKLQSSRCCLPHSDCWGAGGMQETGWTRKQDWPQIAEVYKTRNECSEPRGLYLLIDRMLNSLIGYLILTVQTACALCCQLVYSLTPPPASLEQFYKSYWDAVSWGKSPKHSHQIKSLSTCSLWL